MNRKPAPINFPEHISKIKAYVPGLPISDLARRLDISPENIAKLASNENPLGASPQALQVINTSNRSVSQYPDNDCTDLVSALAQWHGVPTDWIVIGAGSESVIGNTVSTFLSAGRKTAYSQYSFQAYVNAVQRVGANSIVIPSPDFKVDLEGLQASLDQDPSLIYIANPGNPTGTCLAPEALRSFLQQVPSTTAVLLDEAYFEFLSPELQADSIEWVRQFSNLVVTRTFSKAYGLAGLRVGYGIAQPVLADMLRRVRPPFTVTDVAQRAAAAAIHDSEFLKSTLENNRQGMQILTFGLQELGLPYLESHTNFVLVDVGDGAAFAKRMEAHGFILRPVGSYALPHWIRISIGTLDEMHRLLAAMRRELISQ